MMTRRLSLAWLIVPMFLLIGAFFFGVQSADAATLYWVGTNSANFATTADWNTTNPGSCNAGGGDASAAPTTGDTIILDADCDTSLTIPASTVLAEIDMKDNYSGTLTQAGALDVTGNLTIGLGGTLDSSGNGLTIGGNWDNTGGGTYTSGSNTVTFDGTSGVQLINSGGTGTGQDFNNVVVNNSGQALALGSNDLDVDGTFSLTGTFAGNGNNLTIVGAITNNGTFRFQGGETITLTAGMDSTSGKVTYLGDNSVAATYTGLPAGNSYYELEFNSEITNDVFALTGTLDVNSHLTIETDTTLQTGGNDMTIAGDLVNSGTFTHGNAQVTFDGTGTQAFEGNVTLYDFVMAASSARTLEIVAGDTITIANSMSLNGANGALLSIESSTAGTAATIAASGATESTSFLSLKDVALTGQVILCDPGCVNRGGNPGWIIPADALELAGPSSARVISPNGGERWIAGGHYEVTWDMSHDDLDSVSVFLSDDGGDTWVAVAEDLDNTGFHECTVPDMPSKKALARVVGYDVNGNQLVSDQSDRPFVIEAAEEIELTEEEIEQLVEELGDLFDDLFGDLVDEVFTDVAMTDIRGNEVSLAPGGLFRGETLSGVYLVNADGTRSVFPNATVFESHGYSFDDVVTVRDDQLQKLDLGRRVTMAPGRLVKIQSDNRVFEVGTDGLLHHVTSEEQAISRYGETWNQQITDIDVVFWGDYPMGSAL